jgi:hypothetical protein
VFQAAQYSSIFVAELCAAAVQYEILQMAATEVKSRFMGAMTVLAGYFPDMSMMHQ